MFLACRKFLIWSCIFFVKFIKNQYVTRFELSKLRGLTKTFREICNLYDMGGKADDICIVKVIKNIFKHNFNIFEVSILRVVCSLQVSLKFLEHDMIILHDI